MKSEKVSLSKCKTILQSDGSVYNDYNKGTDGNKMIP